MNHIIKRLLYLIPLLLVLSIITFSLSYISAGDPARIIAEKEYGRPSQEQIQNVREEYGFDKPIHSQYITWIQKILKKDLGISYRTSKPVYDEISQRLPITIKLSVLALILLLVIAIPLGILSAVYPNSIYDKICHGFCFLSVSTPSFVVGLGLLYYFGVHLKIISVLGCSEKYLIIPAFTLASGSLGVIIGIMNSSMRKVLAQDYIKTARANGISEFKIISKYAFKNAILPIVTKVGMIFCSFLSGSAIIECIFSIQGVGKFLLEAVSTKDIPVIQAFVMLIAIFIVVINLCIDIMHRAIDKRVELN